MLHKNEKGGQFAGKVIKQYIEVVNRICSLTWNAEMFSKAEFFRTKYIWMEGFTKTFLRTIVNSIDQRVLTLSSC